VEAGQQAEKADTVFQTCPEMERRNQEQKP
jgi:hypothetical protein